MRTKMLNILSLFLLFLGAFVLSKTSIHTWTFNQSRTFWGYIDNKDKADFILRLIGQVIAVIGGTILLLNYFNAQKNTRIAENNLLLAMERFSAENDLNQKRLLSERFSMAVTQLGSETMAVCLGGIFSLESLAKETTAEYWTINEVLCFFLKEKSLIRMNIIAQEPENLGDLAEINIVIKAALAAVGRGRNSLEEKSRSESVNKLPDLSHVNLSALDMSGISIPRVNFKSANFSSIKFIGGSLMGSNLAGADLESSDLS